jgi:hypothetical protein
MTFEEMRKLRDEIVARNRREGHDPIKEIMNLIDVPPEVAWRVMRDSRGFEWVDFDALENDHREGGD